MKAFKSILLAVLFGVSAIGYVQQSKKDESKKTEISSLAKTEDTLCTQSNLPTRFGLKKSNPSLVK